MIPSVLPEGTEKRWRARGNRRQDPESCKADDIVETLSFCSGFEGVMSSTAGTLGSDTPIVGTLSPDKAGAGVDTTGEISC